MPPRKLIQNLLAPTPEKIRAWHGSGRNTPIAQFSREFYGKGAGGDRLGPATYATLARPEALKYMDLGAGGRASELLTERGNLFEIPSELATALRAQETTPAERIAQLEASLPMYERSVARYKPGGSGHRSASALLKEQQSRLAAMRAAEEEGIAEIRRPGTLYELDLDVDPERLLDIDKEVYDQSPFVQRVLQEALGIQPIANDVQSMIAYRQLANTDIRRPKTAQRLEDAGLQGVTARSQFFAPVKPERAPPRNYAIFDPRRIEILRALGLLGVAGTGAAAMEDEA